MARLWVTLSNFAQFSACDFAILHSDIQSLLAYLEYQGVFTDPLMYDLTLKVLVTTIDAQWEGMGDVGSARYEPALLPPCPTMKDI